MTDVDALFHQALLTVWGDLGAQVSFTTLGGLQGVKASLSYNSNAAAAEGRKLLCFASAHVLNVSNDLLLFPRATIFKFLLHEAIHVGYPEHDTDFAAVAHAVGTGSTEREILGLGVLVERELPDGSFKPVTTCASLEEATSLAKTRPAGPGRYRLTH
jgi:hypothetical protein